MTKSKKAKAIATGALALLVLARMTLTLIIHEIPDKAIWPDSPGYLSLVDGLLNSNRYEDPAGGSVDLRRPPGYPAFLAAIFSVFGLEFSIVVMTQLLLTGLIPFLILDLGRRDELFWPAYIGAVLLVLSPHVIFWSLAIMSDSLFLVAVFTSFYFFMRMLRSGKLIWTVLCGVLVGISTLIRPIGMMLVPLYLLLSGWILFARNKNANHVLKQIVAYTLSVSLVLIPWMVRNAQTWGRFEVSSNVVNLFGYYYAPLAMATEEDIDLEIARTRVAHNWVPREGDLSRYLGIVYRYRFGFLKSYANGTWTLFSESGEPNFAKLIGEPFAWSGVGVAIREGGVSAAFDRLRLIWEDPIQRWFFIGPKLVALYQWGLYLFTLLGAVVTLRAGDVKRAISVSAILIAAVIIFTPGPVGTPRFMVPALPFMSLLAGFGLFQFVQLLTSSRLNHTMHQHTSVSEG